MTLWMVLAAWVIASLVLTVMWVGYRRFIGTHSVEEFDLPPRELPGISRQVHQKH